MDDILELASRLGRRIADEPRAKRMVAARAALDASLVDRRLLSEFEDVQGRLYELESSGKPIEPEDKRRFVELQQKVIQSSVIKDLLKAQAGSGADDLSQSTHRGRGPRPRHAAAHVNDFPPRGKCPAAVSYSEAMNCHEPNPRASTGCSAVLGLLSVRRRAGRFSFVSFVFAPRGARATRKP